MPKNVPSDGDLTAGATARASSSDEPSGIAIVVLAAAAPAVGYFCAWFYAMGRAAAFDVPPSLVSIRTEQMVIPSSAAASFLLFLVLSASDAAGSSPDTSKQDDRFVGLMNRLVFALVGCSLVTFVPWWLALMIGGVIGALLWRGKTLGGGSRASWPAVVRRCLPRAITQSLLCLGAIGALLFFGERAEALREGTVHIATQEGESFVFVAIYGDRRVLRAIDPTTGLLGAQLLVLPVDQELELTLQRLDVNRPD